MVYNLCQLNNKSARMVCEISLKLIINHQGKVSGKKLSFWESLTTLILKSAWKEHIAEYMWGKKIVFSGGKVWEGACNFLIPEASI